MIYIDEILQAKVSAASAELDRPIYWFCGDIVEIIGELKKLSEAKSTKAMRFPMVALLRDFPEAKGQEIGIYSEPTVTLLICTRTEPTYNTQKRKEISFKPVLHPIWEALEKQINWGREFLTSGIGLDYTQIDHYFYGRESIYGKEANIFTDFIDCVEIRNLNLKFKQENC
jgi:hypothetical protein